MGSCLCVTQVNTALLEVSPVKTFSTLGENFFLEPLPWSSKFQRKCGCLWHHLVPFGSAVLGDRKQLCPSVSLSPRSCFPQALEISPSSHLTSQPWPPLSDIFLVQKIHYTDVLSSACLWTPPVSPVTKPLCHH